jgi:hypothetical protein
MKKSGRRLGVVGCWLLIVGGLVGFAVAQTPSTERGGGGVSKQSFKVVEGDASTSSAEWGNVPGLRLRTSCPRSHAAITTVSLALSPNSDPVDVRLTMRDPLINCSDCERLMAPEAVAFPGGTSSFTFATDSSGEHGTIFAVEWRLADGQGQRNGAWLEDASLSVIWDKARHCR